jgi:peptidoglycan hydrolase-like protein with peptidoglycan-binding domain
VGTVDSMLIACRNLLGTGEDTPGSNRNFVTDWYGFDSPWCDMAVSYAAAQSGNAGAVGHFAWTPSHAYWFRNAGRWHYGLGGARAGDVVFFDWSGSRSIDAIDHVGVVEAVRADGTIVTLEGNTRDPNRPDAGDVYARRVRNAAAVVGYGRPAYDDAAAMPATDGALRLGSAGELVRLLQTQLGTLGARIGADGQFGPATAAALRGFQAAHGLEVDGVYGPASAAMVKAVLAGASAPARPVPVVSHPAKVTVDGQFGLATVAALQRMLNTHGEHLGVDGQFGPATRRALQHLLGVTADATIGPNTVRALQRWVGAPVDGTWGTTTTRRLQTLLAAQAT